MLNTIENVEFVKNFLIKSRDSDINVLENIDHFFKPKRVFYISSSKKNEIRGGHAHKIDKQIIGCISGKISFTVDDGYNFKNYPLDKNSQFIYVPTNIWTSTKYINQNSIVIVLSSESYDESSYIRNYDEFKKYISSN